MKHIYRRTKEITNPAEIPFSGWRQILIRVKNEVEENNVSIVSAGVAFYAFLAVFPAIGALVSIYALAMDPHSLQDQIQRLSQVMPQQALEVLQKQLEALVTTSGSALSWSLTLGVLLSIWSSNKGTKSLFKGLDIAYDTTEKRGFIKQNALTLFFTFCAILLVILSMAVIVIFPVVIEYLGLSPQLESFLSWVRWALLAALVIYFVGAIFRYAPAKPTPSFRWVVPGALLSTFLWLLASWGFSFYVKNFGSYGEVYGSISAVVVLLLWLFLSSFIILLGAEVNSEIEKYAGIRKLKN